MTTVLRFSQKFKLLICLVVSLFLSNALLANAARADDLTATLDRNNISLNESVQLTIRYSGKQNVNAPGFSELETLFDVVSNNRSNQFISRNGEITSFTEWQLTLIPKKEGKLLIPAFTVAGSTSQPMVVNVRAAADNPVGAQRDVFLETDIESDPIYVQQQLLVTYRLYFTKSINGVDSTPFSVPDAIVEELPTRQFTRTIDGRDFRVAEVRYAVFPQTSGTLDIPALNWDIRVATNSRVNSIYGLSGRYELRRERTDAKSIEVKPQPAAFPANAAWIPASDVKLEQNWSGDPSQFKVGEPITRTLTLNAQGLMSSQLPKLLKESQLNEVKVYTEQPTLNDEHGDNGMSSSRMESAAVIVSQNGKTTLPAVRIPWWDVKSDSLKYAEIPAQQVTASGSVSNASYEQQPTTQTPTESLEHAGVPAGTLAELNLWRLLAVVFGLSSLVFASLWIRLQLKVRRTQQDEEGIKQLASMDYKAALKAITDACNTGNKVEIRDALLYWASLHWPTSSISTLQQLQLMVEDKEIKLAFRSLDKDIYGGSETQEFDASAFNAKFNSWLQDSHKKHSNTQELEAFYATHA
ncbi:hypothetical protein TDB9533_01293 [Thalassocella blandensis]|nr:hypothetical protein TDB9533_01293 [Thalassocella blandensis]